MEGFYLLGSIACTLAKTSLLSLVLAVRSIPHFLFSPAPPSTPATSQADEAVRLYEGLVRHVRLRPVRHAFDYTVRYALIDLDRAPHLQPSRLSADRAREVAQTTGPVFLLTIPASVGYEQNPLSVYYCYDEGSSQQLKMCIAEVTNTPWGERVLFTFDPDSDLVAKPLHVSPFMDMLGNWNIHASSPGDDLSIRILVQHPTLGNYFTATLSAKRINSSSSPLELAIYFWLMPHKVAMWIYWQALKLWWKTVAFISHPKYLNSNYRHDALKRDQQLCCSRRRRTEIPSCTIDEDKRSRWCVWRDAPWPWS
ncbi:hypothetical protein J5N97_010606 [Dioscorea zingiberensis]|uniref:DUF1365 domain-containing protein n=1 Tax=Dioscorea zingiberensis TaxID=325984 RepID=A0A9D5HMY0_9LILI|nr:hypothetical protein J5N97_010606 [Dioscorea zingiberensis]